MKGGINIWKYSIIHHSNRLKEENGKIILIAAGNIYILYIEIKIAHAFMHEKIEENKTLIKLRIDRNS